jgi:guanylate kinase
LVDITPSRGIGHGFYVCVFRAREAYSTDFSGEICAAAFRTFDFHSPVILVTLIDHELFLARIANVVIAGHGILSQIDYTDRAWRLPDVSSNLYERKEAPLLIVISGPSGVGKDTVVKRMRERGLPFHFVVTATSRPRRENEIDGVDYIFVSRDEFDRMIEQNELLEHAEVYGQQKGIPKAQVREALKSGKDVVMRIDVQGARTIRELAEDALLVFLITQSEEELVRRLEKRQTETPEAMKLRLDTALLEMRSADELFDYYVVNADSQLDAAVDTIVDIISAEHHRIKPRKVEL